MQKATVEPSLNAARAGLGCSRGIWTPIGMSEPQVLQDPSVNTILVTIAAVMGFLIRVGEQRSKLCFLARALSAYLSVVS